MEMRTSTDLLQGARLLACGASDDASANAIDPRTHVVAELEPSAGCVRLHVTEHASGYGVTAACGGVDAADFDVQLLHDRVWVGRSDPPSHGSRAPEPRAVERRSIERLFSLIFARGIDAPNSRGERADGGWYLWLKKADAGADAGVQTSSRTLFQEPNA